MDSVPVDRCGKVCADRSRSGFRWVGGAHDLAVAGDCVFPFENHHKYWTRNHEIDKLLEERAVFVDRVELFRLVGCEVDHFCSCNAESVSLKIFDDVADHILSNSIGLDDRKCLF